MFNKIKSRPFFLLLLVAFFCTHGFSQSFYYLTLKDVLSTALHAMLASAITLICFWLFLKRDIMLASFLAFYCMVWYLFFGAIQDGLNSIFAPSFLSKYSVLLAFAILLGLALKLLLKRIKHKWPTIAFYLNLLLVIYIGIDCYGILKQANNRKAHIANTSNFNFEKVTQKPDLYIIVFDGYPNTKFLTQYLHFNNIGFNDSLGGLGFAALNTKSNYDATFYSMSSFFNMQYIPQSSLKGNEQNGGKRLQEIQYGQLFNIAKQLGYEIENNSIFNIHNLASTANNNAFLNGGGALLTQKILINRIKKDISIDKDSRLAKILPFLKRFTAERYMLNNEDVKTSLLNSLNEKKDKPVLSYTHLLMPHEPFFYDSAGNKIAEVFENPKKATATHFVSYLQYTNKIVFELAKELVSKKPNALIVLMSDHGVRKLDDMKIAKADQMENICFIYSPNNKAAYINKTLTNVNILKQIFNREFNQNLPLAKDSFFWVE
jgi:Sulfatase